MIVRGPGTISVVTPTRDRPDEIVGLLESLGAQELRPDEVIIVDGSDSCDARTQCAIQSWRADLHILYVRSAGGAALQRNVGINIATSDFVAFIDDDVRPAPAFLRVLATTLSDLPPNVACVSGRSPTHSRAVRHAAFRFLRVIGLLGTDRPGAFDWASGNVVPRTFEPEDPIRDVDIVGGGAALWRREIFETGLRFSEFFRTFFYGEDEHLALQARRRYRLVSVADAQYVHVRSPVREPANVIGRHAVINRRFTFVDMVPRRSLLQELRFWAVMAARIAMTILSPVALNSGSRGSLAFGMTKGAVAAYRKWPGRFARVSLDDRSDEI